MSYLLVLISYLPAVALCVGGFLFSILQPAHAVDFVDYLIPPEGECHAMSSGEQFCYGQNAINEYRLWKNGNYEQFVVKPDGIYRREDTSWATPDWQPVTCTNGAVASYTYAPCQSYADGQTINNDGALWLPSSGTEGQEFNSGSFRVQAITRESAMAGDRVACTPGNVSGNFADCQTQRLKFKKLYKKGQLTYCTGSTNENDVTAIEIINGPGTGDVYYFEEGKGMTAFQAPGFQTGLVDANSQGGTCSITPVTSGTPSPEPTPDNSPVSIYDLIPPAVNSAPYLLPKTSKPGIYDNNAYANLTGSKQCTFNASISQEYAPNQTTVQNADGTTTTETEPITATSVEGQVDVDGPQTNLGGAKFCTYTAYNSDAPTHHQRYNIPTIGPIRIRQDFTSYGRLGYNPVSRSMSYCEQLALKWQLFQEAIRSLEPDLLKRDPYIIANDQILGYAYHDTGGCRDTNRSGNGVGRPMYMSEYIYEMIKSGDIDKFAVSCVQGKIVKTGVPGDIRTLLSEQYEGGGYKKRTGIDYWTTFVPCYKRGYAYFLATNPGCASVNVNMTIKNIDEQGDVHPTPTPHTMPNLAAMSSGQAKRAMGWWMPAKQQNSIPVPDVCSMGGGYNTPNKPSPLSFFAWIRNLFVTVTSRSTVTAKVEVQADYPGNIGPNEGSLTQTYFNLTPQKDQGRLTRMGSDSTVGGSEKLPIAHPGSQTDINHDRFYPQLLPASWQL